MFVPRATIRLQINKIDTFKKDLLMFGQGIKLDPLINATTTGRIIALENVKPFLVPPLTNNYLVVIKAENKKLLTSRNKLETASIVLPFHMHCPGIYSCSSSCWMSGHLTKQPMTVYRHGVYVMTNML